MRSRSLVIFAYTQVLSERTHAVHAPDAQSPTETYAGKGTRPTWMPGHATLNPFDLHAGGDPAGRKALAGPNRRRAMGMKRLDRLQSPRLAFFTLFFRPDDRFPVWREDEASAGVGDFDAVAAGLIDVEEKRLLDRVLVRAGLDMDAVLQEDVGGAQDFLAAVERVGDVMKAAGRIGVIVRIGEVVTLVRHRHPHRGFGAVVEHDLFGQPAAEIVFKKEAVGFDVDRETIEVIEPANVDAARGKPLRLIFQGGLEFGRRLVPLGLVIEFDDVTVRIAATKRRPLPHVALDPADVVSGPLERCDAALERLRASRPQRHVLHAGGL